MTFYRPILSYLPQTMNNITAIIVDDEESARDVLENLIIRFCPNVAIVGKYENVQQAVAGIEALKPNVVFLDIEMPQYSGYEIVKFFNNIDFDIIFVTAYNQYAIRAFEVAATDYLLKPIDIDRLREAVQKVINKQSLLHHAQERLELLQETLVTNTITSITITEKGQHYIVKVDDIVAIEALESYCFIHLKDKKFIVSKNLKHYETLLESLPHFFRVHKSWLINTNHMIRYSKSSLTIQLIGDIEAKLSKYKKQDFEQIIIR